MNKRGITIIELIITIALVSVIMMFLYNLLSNISFESDNEFIDITDAEVRGDIIRTINDAINTYNYNDYREEKSNSQEFKFDCLGTNPSDKVNSLLTKAEVSGDNVIIWSTDGSTQRFKVSISGDTGKPKDTITLYARLTDPNSATTSNKCNKTPSYRKIQTWTLKRGSLGTPKCTSTPNGLKLSDPTVNMVMTTCTIPVYTDNINNKIIKNVNGTTENFDNNNTLDDITFTFGSTKKQTTVKLASYTLTFNNMGGSGLGSAIVSTNSTSSIQVPTKPGSTFKGYYSDTNVPSLAYGIEKYPSTIRINMKTGANDWLYTNDDKNKLFQASFTITDETMDVAPSQIEFNDYRLIINNEYTVTQEDPHTWRYTISLNLSSDMVKQRGIYNYATDWRFIDIEGITANTSANVSYIYFKEGIYFDSSGNQLANRTLTKDMTLYAKWE